MKFNKETYLNEMKLMVHAAIDKLKSENTDFVIYSANIWTDPNAASSSISFDSKINSDKKVQRLSEWNKKYYEYHVAEGDFEQAKLFEVTPRRNDNPADFELRDYWEINNLSMPENWEESSKGNCWYELLPAINELGEYTFHILQSLKIHNEFELSMSGPNDWSEFVWSS